MVIQFDFRPGDMFPLDFFKTFKNYDVCDSPAWISELNRNVVTAAYILRRLAMSPHPDMRMAVAEHVNTPIEVLLMLAEDENPDVRYAMAENHNISQEILRRLCQDDNPYVAHRANLTLARLVQ